MPRRRISPRISTVLAIVAFIVAALPAFGVVMRDDPVGRAIFAAVWVLVGIAWLGHLVSVKGSASEE